MTTATATVFSVMLAHTAETFEGLQGWLVSEKLDGVRAYWDGTSFWTRNGNRINPPQWYTAALPKVPLDGELWLGRKRFDEGSGIVRRKTPRVGGIEWRGMAFVVFDAPHAPGGVEDRLAFARKAIAAAGCAWCWPAPQTPARDAQHIETMLRAVEAQGGEGLIARRPGSPYVGKRSRDMLKIKTFQDDEATVVEHYTGDRGKPGVFAMWHGVRIKVANGFKLDASNRPPVGTTITFGYFERGKDGKPRFPFYLRVRNDEPTT